MYVQRPLKPTCTPAIHNFYLLLELSRRAASSIMASQPRTSRSGIESDFPAGVRIQEQNAARDAWLAARTRDFPRPHTASVAPASPHQGFAARTEGGVIIRPASPPRTGSDARPPPPPEREGVIPGLSVAETATSFRSEAQRLQTHSLINVAPPGRPYGIRTHAAEAHYQRMPSAPDQFGFHVPVPPPGSMPGRLYAPAPPTAHDIPINRMHTAVTGIHNRPTAYADEISVRRDGIFTIFLTHRRAGSRATSSSSRRREQYFRVGGVPLRSDNSLNTRPQSMYHSSLERYFKYLQS
jgi:hypothetical protein